MRSALRMALLHSTAGIFVVSVAACLCAVSPQPSSAGQSQEHPAQFRVLRSLCGSKAVSQGGQYQIQDPRTTFHVPGDHQIIVYFEWEGPPGSHHAVGSWRGPDGRVVLNSEFDLSSQGTRYTGTWTLAIPDSIAQGLWALEATIDGQPAGTQTFAIVSDRNVALTSPGTPPLPTPAEVYQRAAAASVFVTSLDGSGDVVTRGFGFFVEKNVVLTAFQVIDGARSLRIDFADGSHATVNDVVAWNRFRDWAILKVDSGKVQPLEKASPNSWKVGDLCYILTSQGQGSRTIQSVNLTGLEGTTTATQRLTVSAYGGRGAAGAPLLDSYGRVIGLLGGGLAGMGSSRMGTWTNYIDSEQITTTIVDPTVLPIALIPESAMSQQAVTLADLGAQGVLMMPLPREPQAATGSLCKNFRRIGDQAILPEGSSREFSQKGGPLAVVVTWGPTKKMKGTQQLRIYNVDNRLVAQTAPGKIDLQPRVTLYSAWKVPLNSLQPGVYHVDVVVGDEPQWRQYFRLVE